MIQFYNPYNGNESGSGGASGIDAPGSQVSQILSPMAVNSNTLYGISASNYGLGPSYASTATHYRANTAQNNTPSLFWLAALLAVVALFS